MLVPQQSNTTLYLYLETKLKISSKRRSGISKYILKTDHFEECYEKLTTLLLIEEYELFTVSYVFASSPFLIKRTFIHHNYRWTNIISRNKSIYPATLQYWRSPFRFRWIFSSPTASKSDELIDARLAAT